MEHNSRDIPGINTDRYQQQQHRMPFIDGNTLSKIFPTLSLAYSNTLAGVLNEVLPRYGMDNVDVAEEYLATCAEESGYFKTFTENLNYGAEGLMETWPTRFKTLEFAKQYARKPEKIANYVYANRMGNGDAASGDGWINRGGGAIQLTGKDMWMAYAKYLNKPLSQVYDYVRNTLEGTIDSSCWVFAISKGLIDEAIKDSFKEITLRINGGLTNYDKRLENLARIKQYLR